MTLLVFKALWGMTGGLEQQLEQIAGAGYEGVEAWIEGIALPPQTFRRLVASYDLKLIIAGPINHKADIEPILQHFAAFEPLKINLHSGRDSFTHDEGCAFFETALTVQTALGLPVAHETHRGRLLFTPWDTAFYLRQFPELCLTADYSHWVNVCERLPDDQQAALEAANQRAIHIHGRVGYEEGPQVPDPRALEYAAQVAWHEQQWQRIQANHAALDETLTFTPEYGPPPYLHTLPYTNVPVADLWTICLYGMERARLTLGTE
ncbi:MAG: sugar phosphate isomerase/epimerase [Anaerolineae bacterium]